MVDLGDRLEQAIWGGVSLGPAAFLGGAFLTAALGAAFLGGLGGGLGLLRGGLLGRGRLGGGLLGGPSLALVAPAFLLSAMDKTLSQC